MRHFLTLLLLAVGTILWAQPTAGNPELADAETYGYLYCHRSEHGGWPAYALSQDGIHFHDLLCGDSVFPAELEGRVRGSAAASSWPPGRGIRTSTYTEAGI